MVLYFKGSSTNRSNRADFHPSCKLPECSQFLKALRYTVIEEPYSNSLMDLLTLGISKKMTYKAMESMNGQMADAMKDNGIKIKCMERVFYCD